MEPSTPNIKVTGALRNFQTLGKPPEVDQEQCRCQLPHTVQRAQPPCRHRSESLAWRLPSSCYDTPEDPYPEPLLSNVCLGTLVARRLPKSIAAEYSYTDYSLRNTLEITVRTAIRA